MPEVDWSERQLHFIAIGGAGMSALALVAHRLGARVSGSDRSESTYMERLRQAGLKPRLGHDAEAVPAGAEIVVSTAIPDDNPELARARERGRRVWHRGELLAELCAAKRTLAVAGTHGKTTTAAMIAHALRAIGADPAFVLGGELAGAAPDGGPTNAAWGEGEWIVAEADESDGSFLRLRPEVAVVTNVEMDHHSHWGSFAALQQAFGRFVAGAEAAAVLETPDLDGLRARGRTLRFSPDQGPELTLSAPGRHNLANARAALAAVELVGGDIAAAAAALAEFPGVVRRFQYKGSRDGVAVYDDYAHHPTEIMAALQAARELEPRRLVAVFQPHLYSRTKAFARELGAALAGADEIGVLEIYPAREEPVGELAGVSGRLVAEAAADRAGGRPVWWLPDAEAAARALAPRLGPGDLVLTIGAGDIDRLADALVEGPPKGPHKGPAQDDRDDRDESGEGAPA